MRRNPTHAGDGNGIVFIVASHRNPKQVARLVNRLKNDLPRCGVVVHHDSSGSTLAREALPEEGVMLVEDPIAVRWGESSQVLATIRCLEIISSSFAAYTWVIFISGQDYPLRHLSALPAALEQMEDGQLSVERSEAAEPLRYALSWFRVPSVLQTAAMRALFERLIFHFNRRQRAIRFASGRIGCTVGIRLPNPRPKSWRVYQGSNWWALRRRAVEYALDTTRKRSRYFRWFMKRTIIPDEGYFHTVLFNAKHLRFCDEDIRYIRWVDRDSGSPLTFTIAHQKELLCNDKFFARKFDAELDSAILDALDAKGTGADEERTASL